MIRGDKIELRPASKNDFVRQVEWRNQEETARLAAGSYAALYSHVTVEEVEALYDKRVIRDRKQENVFAIYIAETNTHIGNCDYRDVNPIARSAVVGLTVGNSEERGKGYGTEALQLLVQFLFQDLNLQRVQLDTWSGNEHAIRVYERCGFKIEGRLRRAEYVNGTYFDQLIMGCLRESVS
ncbi:GNAT family protein [Shouchella sp. 1P09AA]|uniref:GNAT family N-acetyltransferase n=1 Tax=unclassified Shouchella TaxID=2893065 RepID=UPI0039A2CCAE